MRSIIRTDVSYHWGELALILQTMFLLTIRFYWAHELFRRSAIYIVDTLDLYIFDRSMGYCPPESLLKFNNSPNV